MSFHFLNIIKRIDWLLIVAVFLLVCFGLSSLYSLELSQPEKNFSGNFPIKSPSYQRSVSDLDKIFLNFRIDR